MSAFHRSLPDASRDRRKLMARSVPATCTVPSANSRSRGLASSASAAMSFRLSASFVADMRNGHAARRDRARSAGAAAGRDLCGVALHHADLLRRQAEMIGDDLRIGRVVPLPGRLRADQEGDGAVLVERHGRGFRAIAAAGFDIGRKADAAQLAAACAHLWRAS